MEDFYIGGASVKLFLPIFKMNFPEIVDIALPAEGGFHNLVFFSIKSTYPMRTDTNVQNTSEVVFHLTAIRAQFTQSLASRKCVQ